jgi:uncharacterized membrane protein YagU involved in acid resistance
MPNQLLKPILLTGLLAATLDIAFAFINAYTVNNVPPARVLQYIASAAFGKRAYEGGLPMQLTGLLFHYLIAMSFAAIFFYLFTKIRVLQKNIIVTAIIFGTTAWLVMTFMVLPLTKLTWKAPVLKNALVAIGILVLAIGLPVSIIAKKTLNKKGA